MIPIKQAIELRYFYTKFFSRNYCAAFNQYNFSKKHSVYTIKSNESINSKLLPSLTISSYNCLNHQRSFSSINETVTNFWQNVSQSTPVAYFQDGLIKIHDFTGLPWWATIIFSTILFRTTIIFPLAVYQNIITARIERITLEMPAIVSELKKETAIAMKKYQWTQKQARLIYNRSLKKQWNNLIVRDNCHPAKTLIVLWAQIPLWICQSVALRNLVSMMPDPTKLEAQIVYAEMTMGGFGWIPNLTEIDSSLILPVTLGLLNLGIIQLQTIVRTKPPNKLQKYATNFFRILSVGMVPIAANVPSCLCFYWVVSSTYGLIQNIILLSPSIRRSMGIPKTQSEIQNPYNHIMMSLKLGNNKEKIVSSKTIDEKSSSPPPSTTK